MKRLSLVIPCYNEARGLPALIERCRMLTQSCDSEVILVDNGSTDATPNQLPALISGNPSLRSIRVEQNRGYGHGILCGLRAAEGRFLGWTHADLQTDPLDCAQGFAAFGDHPAPDALFVKGRRVGRPVGDRIFTIGMAVFETVIFGRPLWDINAQPTLFSRAFFETWKSPPDDFALDLFAYHKAKRDRLDVRRFDVRFPERAFGDSHWNVNWQGKAKFIRRTLGYSIQLRLARG
jgi:glycosyltransferase involved in cell wall biosynthesis